MIEIDQARDLLKRAMETQGRDFRYSAGGVGCFYLPIDRLPEAYPNKQGRHEIPLNDPRRKTGCLIGTALDLDGETRHHEYPKPVDSLYEKYPDMMTEEAANYFQVAQQAQDIGMTWGRAYDKAENWITVNSK